MPVTALLAAELAEACGTDPGFLCKLLFDVTENESIAALGDFLIRPITVILILIVAWVVNRVVRRLIDRVEASLIAAQDEKVKVAAEGASLEPDAPPGRLAALRALTERRALRLSLQAERGRQRAQTLGAVLRSGAALVIYTIALFMILGEFGVNLGPLIASAGIVGIALGFGAQSLVKDFLTGIFMLMEDQYGVGDIVDVGDAAGVVEEVKLRTTKIRDVDGTLWHIPNGEITRVANKSQEWARTVLDVEVAYDTDLSHAIDVIKTAADGLWEEALDHATVLEEPEVWGVERFGSDSIALRVALKVEPSEQFATAREMRRRLKAALDEAGIEIPFPQRTVWLHKVEDMTAAGARGGASGDA